jgi:hypothetical protein
MSDLVLVNPKALEAAASLASTDTCHPRLVGVFVRADGGMVATDGHRLIEIPPDAMLAPACDDYPAGIVPEGQHAPTNAGVIVPTAACKAAAREARKIKSPPILRSVAVSVNETRGQLASTDLDRTSREDFRPADGPFPNYAQIFPTDAPTLIIWFDPSGLAEILLAFAKVTDNASVALTFHGPGKACLIESQGVRGLMMPMLLPKHAETK